MSEDQLKRIADGADMIINGYAFTQNGTGQVRVLNLNRPDSAAVLTESGEMLETSMDDIELGIVQGYLAENLEFLVA